MSCQRRCRQKQQRGRPHRLVKADGEAPDANEIQRSGNETSDTLTAGKPSLPQEHTVVIHSNTVPDSKKAVPNRRGYSGTLRVAHGSPWLSSKMYSVSRPVSTPTPSPKSPEKMSRNECDPRSSRMQCSMYTAASRGFPTSPQKLIHGSWYKDGSHGSLHTEALGCR
jgi:hypothetical protein